MFSRIPRGVVAGVMAGVVFGVIMQMMVAPTGGTVMGMVADILRSKSLAAGWAYHLFNSAVIGGIFGWSLGRLAQGYLSGLGWGIAYGLVWWVLGGLILMPVLLGMSPFAPITDAAMRGIGLGSLFGHLVYGMVLGVGFVLLGQQSLQQWRCVVFGRC